MFSTKCYRNYTVNRQRRGKEHNGIKTHAREITQQSRINFKKLSAFQRAVNRSILKSSNICMSARVTEPMSVNI